MQHRDQEQNDTLKRYFRAFWGTVEASCVALPGSTAEEITELEKRTILALRPRTNHQYL